MLALVACERPATNVPDRLAQMWTSQESRGARQSGNYRVWTRDGCVVRIGVITDRAGPEHCEFQSVRVIITGSTIGQQVTGVETSVVYIRGPECMGSR